MRPCCFSIAKLSQVNQLLRRGKRMVVVVGGIVECPCCFSIASFCQVNQLLRRGKRKVVVGGRAFVCVPVASQFKCRAFSDEPAAPAREAKGGGGGKGICVCPCCSIAKFCQVNQLLRRGKQKVVVGARAFVCVPVASQLKTSVR